MSDIELRPARPADIPAISEIYAHAVTQGAASYELEPPPVKEMEARFLALTGRSFPYIVATDDTGVLGYAYAGPYRERRAYRFMAEDSIYIAPDAQGRGVGRLLLARLIDDLTVLGFRQVIAVIGDGSNNPGSVRLHESLGFTHAGKITGSGFKHGRWLDTVLMQLPLNGGAETLPE